MPEDYQTFGYLKDLPQKDVLGFAPKTCWQLFQIVANSYSKKIGTQLTISISDETVKKFYLGTF